MHKKLRDTFEVVGIPHVFVLEPSTGFLISKKGRKDICDLSVNCVKNWAVEIDDQKKKVQKLREGKVVVDELKRK